MIIEDSKDTVRFGTPDYGLTRQLGRRDFAETRERVVTALKDQGFGVLTEIDVQATMKAKLNETVRPYTILGACNPPLAHRALSAEPGVGLLLPCNVVVQQEADGEVVVAAVDPLKVFAVVDRPEVREVADEVRRRLTAALEAV